ncbi:hypothetical protein E2C01_048271 [Portunus trituberculatus]|uniref:Uncharacterized protein n=1 Tax=Portunus trituberculatus TaxID=210409 RepID=A0A5B7G9R9_PORTR|nr:hypothetical protein [Portunus trituberculatus]
MASCRPRDKDGESVRVEETMGVLGVDPLSGQVKGGHVVSCSGEKKLLCSTNRKFYLLHMNNSLPWVACRKTDVLALHRGGREGELLRDGLSTPFVRRGFVHTERCKENTHPPATGGGSQPRAKKRKY